MSSFQTVAEKYIQLWNERDPSARRQLLQEGWLRDATYCDPLANVSGHTDIDALITSVQSRFPNFAFKPITAPNGYGEHLRFSWGLGPAGAESVVEGSDVVTLKDNRIERVVGFLDKVPPQP